MSDDLRSHDPSRSPATESVDPLAAIVDEYMGAFRRGERPSIDDVVARHPERAAELRDVLSALELVEEVGVDSSSAGAPSPLATMSLPERVGEYRIVREVGRGGMGIVFEAEQETLGRRVALKVLPPHLAGTGARLERFRQEARAAARLHHSNIVPVFGVGEADGVHYYAMQYIEGQPLDRVIGEVRRLRSGAVAGDGDEDCAGDGVARTVRVLVDRRGEATGSSDGESTYVSRAKGEPVSPSSLRRRDGDRISSERRVLAARNGADDSSASAVELAATAEHRPAYMVNVAQLGLQVAEALEYAHAHGVLHRDIKPSNLLLDLEGAVWITDFGLARADGGASLTHTGDVLGTLAYMAPERLEGTSDPRADVYGLGITLYELLTLERPFADSDRARLVRRVASESPPPPASLDPRIPSDLETIVLKAIEKDPHDRYASAGALARDLRAFLEDRPIVARRVSAFERAWRWCRRNPWLAGFAGAAAVLLGLSVIVSAFLVATRHERDTAIELREQAEAAGREARFWERLHDTRALLLGDDVGRTFEARAALAELGRELRDLPLADDVRRERAALLRSQIVAAATQPDVRVDRELVLPFETSGSDFAVAHDPPLVAYGDSDGSVRVLRPRTTEWRSELEEVMAIPPGEGGAGRREAMRLRFSPDGRLLAYTRYVGSGDVQELCVRGMPPSDVSFDLAADVSLWAFDFDPSSRHIAAVATDASLGVYRATTGERIAGHVLADVTQPYIARFAPDGDRLAVSSIPSILVTVVDWRSGAVRATLRPASPPRGVSWHPDGDILAIACDERTIELWSVEARQRIRSLTGHASQVMDVTFDPTGRYLASTAWDTTMRVWQPRSGELLFTFGNLTARHATTFSRDGRVLAYDRGTAGEVVTYRLAPDTSCATLVGHTERIRGPYRVAVGPDGAFAVSVGADGAIVWDVASGEPLARIPEVSGERSRVFFHPTRVEFFTAGFHGVHRWPITRFEDESRASVVIGPPRPALPSLWNDRTHAAALSADGGTLVAARGEQAIVVDTATGAVRAVTGSHTQLDGVSSSPGGAWVATGTWLGENVRVWSGLDGSLVAELPSPSAFTTFSPDGRWLVVSDQLQLRFYEVGGWKLVRTLPRSRLRNLTGEAAYTADGSLLAYTSSLTRVTFVETASGSALFTLEPREASLITGIAFQPDGARLAVTTANNRLHICDLRSLRTEFGAFGLDWEPSLAAPQHAARGPARATLCRGTFDDKSGREALWTAKELADRWPRSAALRAEYARVIEAAGDQTGALRELARAIEIDPRDAHLHAACAALFTALDDPIAARAELDAALRILPGHADWLHERAHLLERLGEPLEAADDYQRLAGDPAWRDEARAHRARVLLWTARVEEGLALCGELAEGAEYGATRAGALADLAWFRLLGPSERRDLDAAERCARRAVELHPDGGDALRALGFALFRRGRVAEAAVTLAQGAAKERTPPGELDRAIMALVASALGGPAAVPTDDAAAAGPVDIEADHSIHAERLLAAARAELEAVRAESGGE